jgi:phosphoribosyl 1,2-cyclic phosphodiesterase
VIQSIEKGFSSLRFKPSLSPNLQVVVASSSIIPNSSLQYSPDALLITHAHDDQIEEFPILIEKVISNSKKLSVFCILECYKQISKKFPKISNSNTQQHTSFIIIRLKKYF